MDIIDANGDLLTLTPDDELFGCMFGTLGYFGVIVSATFKLADNEHLIKKMTEVELDDFATHYKNEVKGKDIPLFGGRLVIDDTEGDPLRKVCMVTYEKDEEASEAEQTASVVISEFKAEQKYGTGIERIALQALSHLSYSTNRRLINKFWSRERQIMLDGKRLTRNEALHPPINALKMLHHSNLHAQWLQEYFIKEENLPDFLRFLGPLLKENEVSLINATIRPTPQDKISVLPYAEQDRFAVVICFSQLKADKEIERTKQWIERATEYLAAQGDVYYQAYMPYATTEQFEACYGKERIENMRRLKAKYDPQNMFSNEHTKKYFDDHQAQEIE
jgi:FAD/FMN-containing dehydrogenase